MADVKAGQKVRLWDGTDEFGFLSTNPVYVSMSDGTDTIEINGDGSINIGSILPGSGALNLGKLEDSVHASGDLGVMALAVRQDTQVDFAADGDYVPLSINANGELRVTTAASTAPSLVDDSAFTIATDNVSPSGYLADETAPDSVDEGDIGLARMTLDRKQLIVITDATTDGNRLAISAAGEVTVIATDLDIRDLTSASDSVEVLQATHDDLNANANIQVGDTDVSTTNPVPVTIVDPGTSNTEVHNYNTASGIAADGTSNHDYTVTGTTFLLRSIIVSASSAGKWEIQTGPVASLATKAVLFTSEDSQSKQIVFNPPIEVPVASTGTVRIIRTNFDNQAQDLYSTIIGNDI